MESFPNSPGPVSSRSQASSCIPTHSSSTTQADLRCCCGRKDCAYLHNNHIALEGLEKDLETAARLGQALLHRHESYMAEAEEDRHRLLANIENLEREKRQVQAENARIVEENRGLLEQLDGLNKAAADSDSYAKSLAMALESAEAELRKLTASAARAADLEAQLAQMESEQSKLQESLLLAKEDSKSAVHRWKKAECTLRDLHDQVDRIEKEAREERERHSDLIQRMERRRTVERELEGAAGRLKGAAAAQNLGQNTGGTNVVSRFVKDILQDNANLQMGIMELREMLESSNQEVQNLRDQILSHQPLALPRDVENGQEPRPSTTLSEELEANESRRVSQEFHIHHHYHTPSIQRKEKGTRLRRPQKRRSSGNHTILHSASSTQLSRKSRHRSQSSVSSASTILSQTSVSIPPPTSRHLSLQSPVPPDSLASSPQSAYRSSLSIFDRVERGFDSSQPTSPDSTVFSSPLRGSRNKNGGPLEAYRTLNGQDDAMAMSDDEFDALEDGGPIQSAIPEETEDSLSVPYGRSEGNHSPVPDDNDMFSTSTPYRTLRRGTSHESLFSVAGMDIHTPSRHPSRMIDIASGHYPVRIPRRIVSSGTPSSPTPVISTSTVTAGSVPVKPSDQSSQSLLASVAASGQRPIDGPTSSLSDNDPSDSIIMPSKILDLGSRVGGWVRGRWGTAAVSSSNDNLKPVNEEQPTKSSASSTKSSDPSMASSASTQPRRRIYKTESTPTFRFRYTGVNQKGPIMGFRPPPPPPVSIHAELLDEDLLQESLME